MRKSNKIAAAAAAGLMASTLPAWAQSTDLQFNMDVPEVCAFDETTKVPGVIIAAANATSGSSQNGGGSPASVVVNHNIPGGVDINIDTTSISPSGPTVSAGIIGGGLGVSDGSTIEVNASVDNGGQIMTSGSYTATVTITCTASGGGVGS